MTKGVLSGLFWGVVVAGIATVFLSLYAPVPVQAVATDTDDPEITQDTTEMASAGAAEITQSDASDQATESDDTTSAVADAETVPDIDDEADGTTPEVDVATTEQPVADPVNADSAVPASPSLSQASDEDTLKAPEAQTDGTVLAEAPLAPTAAEQSGQSPDVEAGDVTRPNVDLELSGVQDGNQTSETNFPTISAATEETETALAAVEPRRLKVPTSPTQVPQTGDAPEPFKAPEPEAPAAELEVKPSTISSDTPIAVPVPKIDNPVQGVVINRLPTLREAEPEEETTEAGLETEVATLDPAEVGALAAFRASVEPTGDASLFAIVLIDEGENGLARDKLLELSLPVTIALDPTAADAAQTMKAYRDKGFEVAIIPKDLPVAASPSDVEVALAGYFEVVEEAVALMDPLDGRIQSNRSLLQPVLGALSGSGHGLITYNRGLNSAQKAARRENIPEATVFRVLDADLENSSQIKRYLDRAAFTANKDGQVVVVGRSYPETVTALLEWSLERKDGDLAIVPVSAAMVPLE